MWRVESISKPASGHQNSSAACVESALLRRNVTLVVCVCTRRTGRRRKKSCPNSSTCGAQVLCAPISSWTQDPQLQIITQGISLMQVSAVAKDAFRGRKGRRENKGVLEAKKKKSFPELCRPEIIHRPSVYPGHATHYCTDLGSCGRKLPTMRLGLQHPRSVTTTLTGTVKKDIHLVVVPANHEREAAVDQGIARLVVRVLQTTGRKEGVVVRIECYRPELFPVSDDRFLRQDLVQRDFTLPASVSRCLQRDAAVGRQGMGDKHLAAFPPAP